MFIECCYVLMQLFADQVPSVQVPLSTTPHVSHSSLAPLATPAGFGGTGVFDENTLDESIWETLKRDVFTIGRNLRSVLIPVNWDFQNHQAALHNWDLWGPLVSCISNRGPCRKQQTHLSLSSRGIELLKVAA
jgi:hypothetical protein